MFLDILSELQTPITTRPPRPSHNFTSKYLMILTVHNTLILSIRWFLQNILSIISVLNIICLKVGLFIFKACVLAVCMTKAQATTFSLGTAVSTSSAGSKMATSMVLSRIVLLENSGSRMNWVVDPPSMFTAQWVCIMHVFLLFKWYRF